MPKTKSGKPIPYMSGGFNIADLLGDESEKTEGPTREQMIETITDVFKMGPSTFAEMSTEDLKVVHKKAISEQGKDVGGRNMGGMVRDELGYMQGGMGYTPRGPIKYAKGGAARGKRFSGSY
tara:strand:+ start:26 stop:391 length:366 start_codon:yes stop_codon:yes gene_type:complete